jgi:hypothetical protein
MAMQWVSRQENKGLSFFIKDSQLRRKAVLNLDGAEIGFV